MTMTANDAASLNAARRARDLAAIADGEPMDVLVVGGGITGTGVALDASSRGLRVVLAERRDLANGTSRWSSKLVHGGLRYLRHGQVAVAWESAQERDVLMTRTAPHLVHALPFVAPLNAAMSRPHGALTLAGIRAGDALRIAAGTPASVLPPPRRITAHEALRLVPSLRPDDLRGGILFWDGQLEDDARLVIAIARTAAFHGAKVITYCDVRSVDGDRVTMRDGISGQSFDVRARHVVNATGVWADRLAPGVRLMPSKGAHVIVPADSLGAPRAALTVPVPHASARWVGATPTDEQRVIIGVTDEAYDGVIDDEPRVTPDEEAQLLEVLSLALREALSSRAVIGRYAGFRPLLSSGSRTTSDLSRRHAIVRDAETGVITVVGGKLTTYRRMAEETVDIIAPRTPSRTRSLPLIGAAPRHLLRGVRAPQRLVRRYGAEAERVVALATHDRSLLEPVVPGSPALRVELLFGLLREGALNESDLLDRRVRLGLVPDERRAAHRAAESLLHEVAA